MRHSPVIFIFKGPGQTKTCKIIGLDTMHQVADISNKQADDTEKDGHTRYITMQGPVKDEQH